MELKKFLMMFFVAVLPMTFVACSDDDDDDDDNVITKQELIGEWQIQKAGSIDLPALTVDAKVAFNADNSFGVDITMAGNPLMSDDSGKYTMDEAKAVVKCEFMGITVDVDLISLVGDALTIHTILPEDTQIPMIGGEMTITLKKVK